MWASLIVRFSTSDFCFHIYIVTSENITGHLSWIKFSDDLDELEVYGADTKGTELASYSFEVMNFF